MAFMDDLNRKISRFSASALEKTKEASDSIKINSAIREEEDRQKEMFRQIGEKFFETYRSYAVGEFAQLCRQVQESMEKAEEYRGQLMKLKGVKTCGTCGREVAANAAFCSHCGAPMREKEPVNSVQNLCANCGRPLEKGTQFCTWCGTPVQQAADFRPAENYPPEKKERVCPKCGSIMREDEWFCRQCGAGPSSLAGENGEQGSENPAGRGWGFEERADGNYGTDYNRAFEKTGQEQPDADASAEPSELYAGIQEKIEEQAEEFTAVSEGGDVDAGESTEPQVKRCPGCGVELRAEQKFCINCGRKCDDMDAGQF